MKKGKSTKPPPGPVKKRLGIRLNRPDDVRRLLARLINETLTGDTGTDTLRAISYAAQTLLRVFEISIIERKLDQIEQGINEIRQQN